MRMNFLRRIKDWVKQTTASAGMGLTPSRLWALLAILLVTPVVLALAYIWLPVPATPLMAWRLAQGQGWERQWVPLAKLPKAIPQAVIASEDNRFCDHNGVDWDAMKVAYAEWQAGEGLRGASTVSMQVARNVFLWPGQDPLRKALEIVVAYGIEQLWGKRRIMEIYLNIVEWGPGVYGIEAAARHHFGKSARQLTRVEIYRLVSILPSPRYWKPTTRSRWGNYQVVRLGRRVGQLQGEMNCI